MANYEDYLNALGHTTDNVITERIFPLIEEITSLKENLESEKQKSLKIIAAMKKENDENAALKKELSTKENVGRNYDCLC